jgi:hypothetical protein
MRPLRLLALPLLLAACAPSPVDDASDPGQRDRLSSPDLSKPATTTIGRIDITDNIWGRAVLSGAGTAYFSQERTLSEDGDLAIRVSTNAMPVLYYDKGTRVEITAGPAEPDPMQGALIYHVLNNDVSRLAFDDCIIVQGMIVGLDDSGTRRATLTCTVRDESGELTTDLRELSGAQLSEHLAGDVTLGLLPVLLDHPTAGGLTMPVRAAPFTGT